MPKRDRRLDLNRLAKLISDAASGEVPPPQPESERVQSGRKGGILGGRARAAKLSPKRRKEIASEAAKKRWGSKP